MITTMGCLPCIVNGAIAVAMRMGGTEECREEMIRRILRMVSEADFKLPPPLIAREVHRITGELSGVDDPYRIQKDESTEFAHELVQRVMKNPPRGLDRFETMVRMAVAGNIIDFGVNCNLKLEDAKASLDSAFTKKIDREQLRKLEHAFERANRILYILDNCGEAVFDRYLIEPYREKITLAVRGGPILNDVTRRELVSSGLEGLTAKVIDTGDRTPGISFAHSSPEFLREFRDAELVIAKGQGNFETLNTQNRPIAFLFMAKCPIVCDLLNGAELNSLQILVRNLPE